MPVFDFIRNSDGAKGSKRLVEVNVASIHPNPYQPRATFDEESIAELAQSIQQVGLLQPLLVRKVDDGYELVAGERRLRAVTSLGMEKVACIVQQDIEDESSAMMALIENLQREDLHYLEEAQCYQKLLETYGLTQEELTRKKHNFELVPVRETVLCLDFAQAGMGSNSCGPELLPQYHVPAELDFACVIEI